MGVFSRRHRRPEVLSAVCVCMLMVLQWLARTDLEPLPIRHGAVILALLGIVTAGLLWMTRV
jgi:hypothetical protein